MRKYANLKEPRKYGGHEVRRIMLHEAEEGVYLYGYSSLQDVTSSFDLCYDSPEELHDDWDEYVDENGWIAIDDPLPGCQHDALIPLRVKGRDAGKPEWGHYETLRDGEWVAYREDEMDRQKHVHFSIDDVFETFWDLGTKEMQSIFDQEYLSFFRKMHERYGCTFSCYCFEEKDGRLLSSLRIPERFTAELHENADWLKFGFHAYSKDTAYGKTHFSVTSMRDSYDEAYEDCRKMYETLTRLCGGSESLDIFPRIHYFAGSGEALRAWKDLGMLGFLSADDDRLAYDFTEEKMLRLKETFSLKDEKGRTCFIRTAFRLEKTEDAAGTWQALPEGSEYCVEIFTHEYFLYDPVIRGRFEECAAYAVDNGYRFGFAQEICQR